MTDTNHRTCECCGKPLVRKKHETRARWRQRRFCGRICANTAAPRKLTPLAVKVSRDLYAAGITLRELGRAFGVHYSTLHLAITRATWWNDNLCR